MALEYPPVPGLDFIKLGRLQSKWEDRYPEISEQPGTPPTPPHSDGEVIFQFFGPGSEPPRRIWAAGDEGRLLQSQNDRLILNWRKLTGTEVYPGYAALRTEFEQAWGDLHDYLSKSQLPEPLPTLAEYTYVNAVPLETGERIDDVVTTVVTPIDELPGEPMFARFQFIRDLTRSEEHPFDAQLHINGEPQKTEAGRRLMFTVTARVLLGERSAEPFAGLDAAHALASHTFARIVTDAKKEQWGRLT